MLYWLFEQRFKKAMVLHYLMCFFIHTDVLITLHGKPYFLFPDVLKRWSFQKNRAGIWSFLYYGERWYFFFPKIWSCPLDGKWKMIFLKKYTEIYFLQIFWKDGLFNRDCAGTWSFLHYLESWYFFPENMIFFPREESERWSFSGNTWKYEIFCVHVRVSQTWRRALLSKKVKDDPAKIHQKVIDALDWHSRKSSSSSL